MKHCVAYFVVLLLFLASCSEEKQLDPVPVPIPEQIIPTQITQAKQWFESSYLPTAAPSGAVETMMNKGNEKIVD